MVATANSIHPTTVALFTESIFATPPADASAWAAAEGTTVDRIRVVEVDPAFVRQSAVVDPNLTDTLFGVNDPIKGLKNADGGGMVVQLHGTGGTTAPASQVSDFALLRLLGHVFGETTRGYSSALTSVTSDTEFELTTTTGVDEGHFYALEDADDTGRLFPVRVLTESTGTVTVDMDVPWTVATADVAHACAYVSIDPDALQNPADANASSRSILIEKAGQAWQIAGCKLQIDSIEFPRNEPPRMALSIFGAKGYPPGDGSPGIPTWTGTIQGAAGLAVGADTKLFIQDVGSTTYELIDVVSVTVTPGIPVTPLDTVTETDDNAQGRAGYGTTKGDTIIEVQAFFDTGWQDDWDTTTEKVIRYFQVAPAGSGWFVHASRAVLMDPPEYGEEHDSGIQTLRFLCKEDRALDSLASNVNRARSKLIVGMF